MPKRRRERDKPKCGPEAAYDPNKRILLSYESNDENVEVATPAFGQPVGPPIDDSALANYQIAEYPDDDDEPEVAPGAESQDAAVSKVNRENEQDASAGNPRQDGSGNAEMMSTKPGDGPSRADKQQENRSGRQGVGGRTDTGQRVALGAAAHDDGEDDDEEQYDSTTEEALAYLESVKTERLGLPEILAATRQVSHVNDDEEAEEDADDDSLIDHRTYIAQPESASAPQDDCSDPRRVFTKALKERFTLQRKHLHMQTKPTKSAELGEGVLTTYHQGDKKQRAQWHRTLSSRPPMPAQLRAMSQETVFNLLELLQSSYIQKGKNIKTVTSAWIWSLLGRLDEVGNMNNDQVYPLRELGKRVVLLQLYLSDPEAAAQLEALGQREVSPAVSILEEHESDIDAAAGESCRITTSGMQYSQTHHAEPTENTLATLDMILVIVGEIFGQRDLLEFRQPWRVIDAAVAA